MIIISVLCCIYQLLIAFELWNEYAKEICKDNALMKDKDCEGWYTGIRGLLLVIIQALCNAYFCYIHWLYCCQMTVVLRDYVESWFSFMRKEKKTSGAGSGWFG